MVLENIKSEIENNNEFGVATNSNDLFLWSNKGGLASIELDYENVDQGMISFTVFANE